MDVKVLGSDVCQQGSLVAHDRLRFDFNTNKALKDTEITQIESLVNDWIQQSIGLTSCVSLSHHGTNVGDRMAFR